MVVVIAFSVLLHGTGQHGGDENQETQPACLTLQGKEVLIFLNLSQNISLLETNSLSCSIFAHIFQ